LTLFTLVISQCLGRAGELATTLQASLTPVATNGLVVAETNAFSVAFSPRPAFSLAGAAALRSGNTPHPAVAGFVLTHKQPAVPSGTFASLFAGQPGNGNFGILNFELGYGQAYDPDSVVLRSHNGTATEEPAYVFFKRVVKF
jgi:hypothetical protein